MSKAKYTFTLKVDVMAAVARNAGPDMARVLDDWGPCPEHYQVDATATEWKASGYRVNGGGKVEHTFSQVSGLADIVARYVLSRPYCWVPVACSLSLPALIAWDCTDKAMKNPPKTSKPTETAPMASGAAVDIDRTPERIAGQAILQINTSLERAGGEKLTAFELEAIMSFVALILRYRQRAKGD